MRNVFVDAFPMLSSFKRPQNILYITSDLKHQYRIVGHNNRCISCNYQHLLSSQIYRWFLICVLRITYYLHLTYTIKDLKLVWCSNIMTRSIIEFIKEFLFLQCRRRENIRILIVLYNCQKISSWNYFVNIKLHITVVKYCDSMIQNLCRDAELPIEMQSPIIYFKDYLTC